MANTNWRRGDDFCNLRLHAPHYEYVSKDPSPQVGFFHDLKQQLVEEFERTYLARVLDEAGMNLSRASRCSGLSRKHIRTLMAKYGMTARRTLLVPG